MGKETEDTTEAGAAGRLDPYALLQGVPGVIAVVDEAGQVMWINDAMTELTGFTEDDLIGSNMLDHLDLEWNPLALESISYALATPGMRLPTMLRFHTKFGEPVVMEATANNQLENPAVRGLIVHLRPSDERQHLDAILESFAAGDVLADTLRRVHLAARSDTLRSECAVVLRSPGPEMDSPVVASSAVVAALTERTDVTTPWGQAAALAQPVIMATLDDVPPGIREVAQAEGFGACWCFPVDRSGSDAVDAVIVFWRHEEGLPEPTASMVAERLVRLCGLVLERVEHSRALQHAASHDPLTGLVNRASFFDGLDAHMRGPETVLGVLYLDLDGFKPINDKWGHGYGDKVLMAVADRLRASVRAGDTVARLGGDEFAIACPGADETELIRLAERILAVVRAPITAFDAVVRVGTTVGLATCTPGACSGDVLVATADRALLTAKASAKGTWRAASM